MTDDIVQTDLSTLPEDVQKHIRELRSEAGGYRVERNEFKQKYEESAQLMAKANERLAQLDDLSQKHEQTLATNATLEDRYNRLTAAAEFGITKHADRLRGGSIDELRQDAEELSKSLGTKASLPADPANAQPAAPKIVDPILQGLNQALGISE
jgi:uncharacterized coiled-coil DUF342 family protein